MKRLHSRLTIPILQKSRISAPRLFLKQTDEFQRKTITTYHGKVILSSLAIRQEDTGMALESTRKIKRPLNAAAQATKNPNVYMAIKGIECKYGMGDGSR